jgi:hypothetical protein
VAENRYDGERVKKIMLKRSTLIPILIGLGIVIGVFGLATEIRAQKNPLIKEGDLFPGVALKTPGDANDRSYLQISDKENFAIKEIKAKVILVEIMNVYCASCQNLAPRYNELFARIQSDPDTRKKIKIIGIAAGNNDQEVKIFRDHFQVPYPIIPDPKYVMHEAIGGSPTPFSIFVRREEKEKIVLVAGTHLGFTEHLDEEVYQKLTTLMNVNLKTIRKGGEEIKGKVLTAKPIYSEEEIQTRIKEAFTQTGGELTGFERILLKKGRVIYTGIIEKDGQSSRLFAEVVSQLPTCDVCHDIHFIYTFDTKGKIRQFVPLQLTKYGNLDWDEADVAKIRHRIIGRYIYNPLSFNARVDAVTSATITSAAIFKGLDKGRILFEELKKKGLI